MAANTSPIFTDTGNFLPVRITGATASANLGSDGSGTPGTNLFAVVTAGVDGTRVDGVRFRNSQTTQTASSATLHKVFLSNTGGTNLRLVGEIATGNVTRSATVIGATSIITFDQPIIMQSGQVMYVAQSVVAGAADQFDAIAYAADY
jgi:hypothetical protein